MQKNNTVLAVVVVLALFGLVFVLAHPFRPKPNVLLDLAPTTATVLVDGKKTHVYAEGIVVKPGAHTLKIQMQGFSTFQKSITVSDKTISLAVALDPIDDDGYNFLRGNRGEALHRESIIGKQTTDTGIALAQKNPVTKILPYIDQYFRIDYGSSVQHPTDSTAIAVYITPFAPDGKDRALALLKAKGFDPNTLEIIYSAPPTQ